MPKLQVGPGESLFWADLAEVRASGLEPFMLYRLELSLEHKTKFRSLAYYFSDEHGALDLAREAPVFGMYKGIDKMGLFTALYTHPGERQTAKLLLNPLPEFLEYTLSLYHREETRALDTVKLARKLIHPGITREPIKHDKLEGALYCPKTRGPEKLPCILDLYGVAMGTKEHRAAMLAAQGYCVLALAIFGTGKLSKKHEDVTSEYLQLAVDFLTQLPYTQSRCAVVGTSFGGTLGYHLTFEKPEVACAVSINGQRGHYMVSQMNAGGEKLPWTPVLPHNLPNIDHYGGFISYGRMYGSCELDEEHMLRFEKLRQDQHLLYIAGGQDRAIDAQVQGREIERLLESNGVGKQFELLELPDCGHIIDPPYMPLNDFLYQGGRYMAFGGDPYPHGVGQHVAWKKLLEFLEKHIGPGTCITGNKL
ncbi:unnamed protein product, partial [Mesorhabditis spiculigera]